MSAEKEIIVGGQAVIEGVMMRAPNSYAVSVRRPDGTIATKAERLPKLSEKYPFLKIPILRGSAVLIHSMILGVQALNFSASVAFEEAEAEGKDTTALNAAAKTGAFAATSHAVDEKKLAKASEAQTGLAMAGSIVFGLGFSIFLFVVLPLLITNFLFVYFGWENAPAVALTQTANQAWYLDAWHWLRAYMKPVRPSLSFNIVDGIIRMAFFVAYIFIMTMIKDIRRVFEYHGAEHKTVYAWEAGDELTVANVKRYPRQHPRCGTSFLMLVMLVSILVFSIIKFDSLLFNLISRVALVPLIAGISYEIIKLAGKKEASAFFSFITRPGIWLQNLTTKEPSDDQLEVAIHALKESLKLEPDAVEVSGIRCNVSSAAT
ncbi:MAG: DUF1385 domain-containing protein [Blastocatellia bacterium]